MSKDFPKTAEGGTAAPADKPDRVGPVAGNVDPEPSTKAVEAKASPDEHAKALGGVKTVMRTAVIGNQPASFELYHQFHAGAEALHGWREHAHHAGEPIKLSVEDYKAALKAASEPVTRVIDKDGKPTGEPVDSLEMANKGIPTITDYEPHAPALSPHKGKGL
jgi:hypothetical protein